MTQNTHLTTFNEYSKPVSFKRFVFSEFNLSYKHFVEVNNNSQKNCGN